VHSALDERIPFVPAWSWVYSLLYYPAILCLNLLAQSPGAFTRMAFSFIVLLALQMVCFTVFPVATPAHWRALALQRAAAEGGPRSLRLLRADQAALPHRPAVRRSAGCGRVWAAGACAGLLIPAVELVLMGKQAFAEHCARCSFNLHDLPGGEMTAVAVYEVVDGRIRTVWFF
jgi:hypothetical protein